MAYRIPSDGANFLWTALKAYAPVSSNGLYVALCSALPADGATMASGMNEIGAAGGAAPSGGTGAYDRKQCTLANLDLTTTDTLKLNQLIEFTGFTYPNPITSIAIVTVLTGTSGKIIAVGDLTAPRTVSNTADKISFAAGTITIQLV